jgi:prepilin-type N-terminal cleavage/methylation domain-containing protein
MRNRQKGFSLIELLIVVAIILIIAAIAIPNLLRSKIAANEASAVATLRTMNTAAQTYSSTWGNGYPPTQASMGGAAGAAATCNAAQVIDAVLAVPGVAKSGFNITYSPQGAANPVTAPGCAAAGFQQFLIAAIPVTVGTTGQRSFCTNESGVIRADPTGAAIGTAAACLALLPIN